ncbi:unnamed protein product [Allacma fusca]|uniref:Uncharacterized protein n=1 Tax=Allacma fusca TaxID=39272 RepID=A0A8J2L4T4_9HEXA|nr:unnamed protein product [Allacma fusca]
MKSCSLAILSLLLLAGAFAQVRENLLQDLKKFGASDIRHPIQDSVLQFSHRSKRNLCGNLGTKTLCNADEHCSWSRRRLRCIVSYEQRRVPVGRTENQ